MEGSAEFSARASPPHPLTIPASLLVADLLSLLDFFCEPSLSRVPNISQHCKFFRVARDMSPSRVALRHSERFARLVVDHDTRLRGSGNLVA